MPELRHHVELRSVRADEHDAVGELTASAYLADGLVGDEYAAVLRDVPARAAVAEVLVAVEGDQLLGTVTLVGPDAPSEWLQQDRPGAGTIRMLAVAPQARGRGIGTLLTRECIRRAQDRGWPELTLLTQTAMKAAHRIYEREGFRRAAELDWEVRADVRLLGYSLELQATGDSGRHGE